MALPLAGLVSSTALRTAGTRISSALFGNSIRSTLTGLTAGSLIPDGFLSFGGGGGDSGGSEEPTQQDLLLLGAIGVGAITLLFGVMDS